LTAATGTRFLIIANGKMPRLPRKACFRPIERFSVPR
jgi:hypothetical protein